MAGNENRLEELAAAYRIRPHAYDDQPSDSLADSKPPDEIDKIVALDAGGDRARLRVRAALPWTKVLGVLRLLKDAEIKLTDVDKR